MRQRLWGLSLLVLAILLPASVLATTRYVHGTSGNDGNSCSTATSATPSNAKRTIAGGLSCTSGGDELVVRGGTGGACIVYAEGGFLPQSGSAGAYTTVRVPSGECAHVRPNNMSVDYLFGIASGREHIGIEAFNLDGDDTSSDMFPHAARKSGFIIEAVETEPHDIKLINNEMMRSRHSCVHAFGYNWEARGN